MGVSAQYGGGEDNVDNTGGKGLEVRVVREVIVERARKIMVFREKSDNTEEENDCR